MIEQLQKRLIELTYKHKLSHLSSTMSALPIMYDIYNKMVDNDIFILSSGHAGLAQYICLEHKYGIDAEMLLEKYGIHPGVDPVNHIYASSGSLGCGLSIAVGFALSNKFNKVHVLISDGECAEGIVWESLAFIQNQKLDNIEVYCNINGQSACDYLDIDYLQTRLTSFLPGINIIQASKPSYGQGSTEGLESHYHVIRDDEYGRYVTN